MCSVLFIDSSHIRMADALGACDLFKDVVRPTQRCLHELGQHALGGYVSSFGPNP